MSNGLNDRTLCSICHRNVSRRGRDKCSTCSSGMSRYDRGYTKYKKDYCENVECTSTIKGKWMLSVDHIDGDHSNNEVSNLQTFCLNCSSDKTHQNREYLNIKHRG